MNSLTDRIEEIERKEIINALEECNWVMSSAARKQDITETRLESIKIKEEGK